MRLVPRLLCALLLVWAPVLAADPCELAVEPAATLLLPYFEVDLSDPQGVTTLLSINNARSEATLAQLTFWTDYGVPTINFPIYLTGFDVATINLRSVFEQGYVPITASESQDPNDTISPSAIPEWEQGFESCDIFLPLDLGTGDPAIPQAVLQRFREFHSGQEDSGEPGMCRGKDFGDGRLRGYVTIDNVNGCSLMYPNEEGYFGDGGTGLASNVNQLWGDFYLIDSAQAFAQGDSLVHIQAFDGVGEGGAWEDGDLTFYGRYVERSAIDNREPLPSVFGARYLGDFGAGGGTELLVWRDTNVATAEPLPCGDDPSWYPLTQRQIYDFDEQENPISVCSDPGIIDPPPPPGTFSCLRLATQRLPLGRDQAPVFMEIGVNEAGWLHMDLNQLNNEESQAWVIALLNNAGRFSVGLPAVALFSSCDGLPELEI